MRPSPTMCRQETLSYSISRPTAFGRVAAAAAAAVAAETLVLSQTKRRPQQPSRLNTDIKVTFPAAMWNEPAALIDRSSCSCCNPS